MSRWAVRHRTAYDDDEEVTDSLGVAYLTPRDLPWQRVLAADVTTTPRAADVSTDLDHYENTATYFQVTAPHTSLEVHATSTVEVDPPAYDADALATPWERCRPAARPDVTDAWRAVDLALPSRQADQGPAVAAYAAASLRPGRPVGEAVTDLVHRVHADFGYEQGATTVTSSVAEVLEARAGVCQDFAHVVIAGLRSHGLAVRYVSGYLATDPAPGAERLVGADASHAWASVWLPTAASSWLAVDPTNDCWAGERHVTVAWGRDYGDVPPVKGVIFTDATTSTLSVEVDVVPA